VSATTSSTTSVPTCTLYIASLTIRIETDSFFHTQPPLCRRRNSPLGSPCFRSFQWFRPSRQAPRRIRSFRRISRRFDSPNPLRRHRQFSRRSSTTRSVPRTYGTSRLLSYARWRLSYSTSILRSSPSRMHPRSFPRILLRTTLPFLSRYQRHVEIHRLHRGERHHQWNRTIRHQTTRRDLSSSNSQDARTHQKDHSEPPMGSSRTRSLVRSYRYRTFSSFPPSRSRHLQPSNRSYEGRETSTDARCVRDALEGAGQDQAWRVGRR